MGTTGETKYGSYTYEAFEREPYWPIEKLRVSITGAGGFIASHIARRLKTEGHYIIASDWKKNEHMPEDMFCHEFHPVDLRVMDNCLKLLPRQKKFCRAGICCYLRKYWNLVISMPAGQDLDTPYSLKRSEEVVLDQDLKVDGPLPEKVSCYQGVFYNYFSIGMDAQVAYGFHHLRNKKPYLAQGPVSNKLIYSSYSCIQGWFFTPCTTDPGLRGLNNILRLHVKRL